MSLDREHAGRRVRLVRCTDPYTDLRPGDEGDVQFVNSYDLGDGPQSTLCVKWDSGSSLSLVEGEDQWVLL